jgi:Tol biopolymer transport system component
MPLVAGARFGAFEVVGRIGSGGMGEVFRARDTRLDRTVALKVIRASDVPGRDRLQRFLREARAISRLNHPHICALYDIGEQDGEAFLVMEYVAGETLADRLARGPLRVEEALRYGLEIADALEAAHRSGVVHRDLKPSNIMIGRDGVKLLDFGLAKLRDPENETSDSTAALGLSEDGLVIGSLPYMSPEQVEGRRVDARTDLFALGAVLYEMVTGEAPFRGTSKASLIVAILSAEPTAPVIRQPLTPSLLDYAIRRCLAKAPEDRWQTAADLSAALKYIATNPHQSIAIDKSASIWRRRAGLIVGAAALASVVLLMIAFAALESPRPAPPSFERLTYRRGVITGARVAPDGQTVLYSAAWEGRPYDLYQTRIGSRESRPLGIPDARLVGISKTGELAFMRGPQMVFRAFGLLARVPLAGGTPRDLLENVAAADWTADGSELTVVRLSPGGGGRVQIEFPIGHKVFESTASVGSVRVSPTGDHVAFMVGGQAAVAIGVVDREGHVRRISEGWSPALGLVWSPRGDEIWFTGARVGVPALHAVTLDGKERLLAAAPDLLQVHDVTSDGRVLAVRHYDRQGLICRSPGDDDERDSSWFEGSSPEAVSSDGRIVVFGEDRGIPAQRGVYLRKTDGSPAVRLGDGYPEDISPDGQWVLARTRPQAPPVDWVLLPVGAGLPRLLPRGNLTGRFEANFLPDGSGIVFGGAEKPGLRRIYVQDLTGGVPRPISPDGVRTFGVTTPDGRFVIGSTGGRYFLYPIAAGDPRPLPYLSAEDSPVQWSADGRFLYVVHAPSSPDLTAEVYTTTEARVDKVDSATGHRTVWKTLKPFDPVGLETVDKVLINRDGTAYCYGYLRSLSDLFIINGLR